MQWKKSFTAVLRPLIPRRIIPWLHAHHRQLLLLFVGVLAPLWVFSTLAEEVIEREPFGFDAPLLHWLSVNATPGLDQAMLLVTQLGHSYGVVPGAVLGFLLFVARRHWGDALFWSLALAGTGLLNTLAKLTFRRARPELPTSIISESTFSFPSGHAMGSMAFVAALVVLLWPTRWRWPLLLIGGTFVALVGLSRVYLGVHYPSDILAGWAAALAWVVGVSMIVYGRPAKATTQSGPTLG